MADMQDLFGALQMLKQGVNDLATSRTISDAFSQVQQIKASELDDTKKRAALQDISNQMVGHMTALGNPVSAIQNLAASFGPQHYANSNQMFADATMKGDTQLAEQAKTVQGFEQDPEYKMQLMRAKADGTNQLHMAQFQALQDERLTKHFEGLDKMVDTQTSRFGNISKLQGVNNQIKDAQTLLDHPEQILPETFPEIARKFDSILSQGASTVSGSKELTPNTLKQLMAKSREFMSSKPQAVDMPEFVNYYKQAFQRINDVNEGIIKGAQKNIIQARGGTFAKQNPDAMKMYIQQKLGENAEIDPSTGKITFLGNMSQPETGGSVQPAQPSVPAPGAMPDFKNPIYWKN